MRECFGTEQMSRANTVRLSGPRLLGLGGDCCCLALGLRQLTLLASAAVSVSSQSEEYGLPSPVSMNALRLPFTNMLHAFEHNS